jgi:mono/diheme cytochrome c family protein
MLRILLLTLATTSSSQAGSVDFVRDVRPIFIKHCYSCHGPEKQKSSFRLDVKAAAFKGGDGHGAPVIAGKPSDSPLIQFVTGKNPEMLMPPKGERLSAAEIKTLTSWIQQGANWPEGVDTTKLEDKRDHWSFKPIRVAGMPTIQQSSWPRNGIDTFILARLEKEGLKPATEADRVTWLRRVSFDLVGLPPMPTEVDQFLSDRSANAYERVVDRLLASPRYGERWAQHWLDVVRFADTHGFEVNTERPNAWPYRDYVIAALNQDTPYDRFIREQIVGDVLNQDAATGFLVTSSVLLPGQIGQDEPSKRLARQDALDEIVINIGQSFLGLSIGCARCHDHKFDPILQTDYYSMQAFIAGVEYGDRPLRTADDTELRKQVPKIKSRLAEIQKRLFDLEPIAGSGLSRSPVNAKLNIDRFSPIRTNRIRFNIQRTNNLEPCIDELEVFDSNGKNVALASNGAKIKSSGDSTVPNRHELKFINDGKYGNSRSWMSNQVGKGWVEIEFPEPTTIHYILWGRDRRGEFSDRLATQYLIEVADEKGKWQKVADATDRSSNPKDATANSNEATKLMSEQRQLESRLAQINQGPLVFAGTFRKPDEIHLLSRGDPEQPKQEVVPAVLSALGDRKLTNQTPEQERRKALAEWITSPENPLTARVMVNRLWQGHFGTGLVETASDFGRMGTKPTHPELLDWLANEFVQSGWSIKSMHRQIVLSATYRQSTEFNPVAASKDVDNRLLWKYPSRRLDGEMIRDSMLAISGRLNQTMGGRGYNLFDQRGGLSGFKPIESFNEEGRKRMIYAHRVRRERDAVFGALDCPDNGQSTARRRESTTPIQALNLFNSQFTIDESEAFANRIRNEMVEDPTQQTIKAYELTLSRKPSAVEIQDALPIVREHGLATLCRVLFNSNEFLFLP